MCGTISGMKPGGMELAWWLVSDESALQYDESGQPLDWFVMMLLIEENLRCGVYIRSGQNQTRFEREFVPKTHEERAADIDSALKRPRDRFNRKYLPL